jgi:hypothetical protein
VIVTDQDQEHHATHPSRTAFANEVADLVEQRIWAKMGKWMLLNIGVLITSVSVGIAAYYSHEARLNVAITSDQVMERQIAQMAIEHAAIRSALSVELREINSRLDEINRFLRDHNNGRK